jgi:hypothetical protein
MAHYNSVKPERMRQRLRYLSRERARLALHKQRVLDRYQAELARVNRRLGATESELRALQREARELA